MPNNVPIENRLESALFFRGGAMSLKSLATALNEPLEAIEEGITSLAMSLEGRGIRLVREGTEVALATAPDTHELIESMRREELEGPLGKAGLETLAVIIFRGPLSRADIEYVRGVNCSTILRSLTIRGLAERIENPNDKRGYLYKATPELPAYLGVGSLSEIPEYEALRESVEKIYRERDAMMNAPTSDKITDEAI